MPKGDPATFYMHRITIIFGISSYTVDQTSHVTVS